MLLIFMSFLVSCVCVSLVQALLTSSGQDRSTGLEAHMVSANSRYIEEQQEQQQVEIYKEEERKGREGRSLGHQSLSSHFNLSSV